MDIQEQKHILDVFRQLLEMSQRRGCWMAHEMEHVGMTYNRVSAIHDAILKFEEDESKKKLDKKGNDNKNDVKSDSKPPKSKAPPKKKKVEDSN